MGRNPPRALVGARHPYGCEHRCLRALALRRQTCPLRRTNPARLFSQREVGTELEWSARRNFDVTADGQRFIVTTAEATALADTSLRQINVVLNWHRELMWRVPVP